MEKRKGLKKGSPLNVLLLQGGGALGAYQGGAFEALQEESYQIDWVAGISIGAINAAIIAGNHPENRTARLKAFWDLVTNGPDDNPFIVSDAVRGIHGYWSAAYTVMQGIPGFFTPRYADILLSSFGGGMPVSFYDTSPLEETLNQLIDFDLLNDGPVRLSVGAVDIETGNMTYFDSQKEKITARHIMASGALPPGFPPVQVDGRYYWDGGLLSNTPLTYILDTNHHQHDLCIFQVDLFSSRGRLPENYASAAQREKDIRFSSRTRLNTDMFKIQEEMSQRINRVLEKLPEELKSDEDIEWLAERASQATVTIVHLIYRRAAYETYVKDYEFSKLSMNSHWTFGFTDVRKTLSHPEWVNRQPAKERLSIFDLNQL